MDDRRPSGSLKGDANQLCRDLAVVGYADEDLDLRDWTAASLQVFPAGGTVDLQLEGAVGPKSRGVELHRSGASLVGIAAPMCVDLACGCPWLRVKVTRLDAGASVTILGVPFVGDAAVPPVENVSVAAVPGAASDLATATNASATVTYPAVPGQRNEVGAALVSYSAAPTGGRLQVLDGAAVILDVDITAAGDRTIALPRRRSGTTNTAMSVVLAAGGVGIVGKLTVLDHGTGAP